MRRSLFATAGAALVLTGVAAPLASADKLPPLASEQNPPRFIDESTLKFHLMHRTTGYHFVVDAELFGPVSQSDAVRVDFVHKGKVLASKRCPLEGGTGIECKYEDKVLKAVGPVIANVIYIDDQAEKEYLLRQLKVTVAEFKWMKEKRWQILHDDLLGTAFLWHQPESQTYEGRGLHELVFYLWVTGEYKEEPQLRCTVEGKKVPDIQTNFIRPGSGGVAEDTHVKGKERKYRWNGWAMQPYRLHWGTEKQLKEKGVIFSEEQREEQRKNDYRFLYEMQGDWACNLRYQGEVIRQFSFHVNDKGMIDPSAAQQAPGFPMLPPGVVHVDMRLPKNKFDTRVRSDAIKRSMRYGMPWPKHASIEEFKKSLPAPFGLSDP